MSPPNFLSIDTWLLLHFLLFLIWLDDITLWEWVISLRVVSLVLFFNWRLGLGVQIILLWIMISPAAVALVGKPLQDLSTAEMLVLNDDLTLARRYLHPSIYSPHISSKLRSRFYYVKGYTFMKEGLHVSAGKELYRALEFDASNPDALYCLGQLYYHGRGYDEDVQMGLSFFREAADFSHQDAKF